MDEPNERSTHTHTLSTNPADPVCNEQKKNIEYKFTRKRERK